MNEPFKKHARRSQELQNRNKKKRNILDTLAYVKAIVRKQATTGLEERWRGSYVTKQEVMRYFLTTKLACSCGRTRVDSGRCLDIC